MSVHTLFERAHGCAKELELFTGIVPCGATLLGLLFLGLEILVLSVFLHLTKQVIAFDLCLSIGDTQYCCMQ